MMIHGRNMNDFLKKHDKHNTRNDESKIRESGIVLLLTMVVLTVFAILGYTLASRVAAQRHRDNFIIDYTNACYARDSALKYALTVLQDVNDVNFVERPNEPDFSDLFSMTEPKYREMIENWAAELAKRQAEKLKETGEQPQSSDSNELSSDDSTTELLALMEGIDPNLKYAVDSNKQTDIYSTITIRGPYGPVWPYVTEPAEFEIGATTVKIETEDENAKFPAGWAILDNEKAQREAQASTQTFFEWMGYDSDKMEKVNTQLRQIAAIKPFKVEFQNVAQREAVTTNTPPRRGARAQRVIYRTRDISGADQALKQCKDFSMLFHSTLLDTQMLAEPTITSETRKESALKYMGLWGTTQVNINSAPRNVLEAAFAFGGDAQKIADEIIKRRREKAFASIDDLKKDLFRYSDSIDKCKPYITTTSSVYSIHVTATSGVAKASAIVVVMKTGDKIEQVAILCG
jgi:hypothetical protein